MALLLATLLAVLPLPAALAHDVAADVRVLMFVLPQRDSLQLLVRVPMTAMTEVDFPRRGPGFLDLPRAGDALRNAANLWVTRNLEIHQRGTALAPPQLRAVRVSLESDKSFTQADTARASIFGAPLPADTDLYWNQGMLDIAYELPWSGRAANGEPDSGDLAIRARLDRLGLKVGVALRYLPQPGVERAFEWQGDPGLVALDPRWHQVAVRFVASGIDHILEGSDHLLFLLCLVLPMRRLRPLVGVITAFTAGHTVSLFATSLDLVPTGLWFAPAIELLIAASILYMAIENMLAASTRRRWFVALAFGLVHGCGFGFGLRESLQFAGSHLVTSLLAFNVGVELGQLAALAVMLPALALLVRAGISDRMLVLLVSAFVAHTGWHWLLERWQVLSRFAWPALDATSWAVLLRGLIGLALVLAAGWLVDQWLERRRAR